MECKEIVESVECTEEEMDYLEDSNPVNDSLNSGKEKGETMECKEDSHNHNDEQSIVLGNSNDDKQQCSRHPHGNGKTKACCRREAAKLRKKLVKLKKECERLRALILEKLLELSNLLVEYERSKSSRYPYVPDKNPSEETIVKIAGYVFPEFRRVERILKFVAELIQDNKFDNDLLEN